jgi:NitT/TauT family transport system ATP-binding protein
VIARSPAPALGAASVALHPSGEPVISLRNVSRRFRTNRNDTLALDDISLEIREGEFVCVVGPSGCGKSTLLNLVAGFDRPTSGEIRSGGTPVSAPGPDRIVVFQEAALFPWMNVRANVEFGLKLAGAGRHERHETASRYLRLVGLERFERAYVHELSGGMKQRVQLARSLAVQPRILLMDEPFAALDAQTRDQLQDEVQRIWAETGTTILFITHNVREAVLLADRVIVMSASPGRIKREIPIPLEHPRDPDSHGVVDLAAAIREELRNRDHVTAFPGFRYAI